MTLLRPATPGFLVTLIATVLLAVVTFSVPYFKTIYFLKASLSVENIDGSVTFGTLGYCLELPNGTTCSKPSIGYELNINQLVGDNLPIQIPNVVVKWITYALFLHAVALILAAGSAVFGLLAHVREMSMACCSTCISGFAAGIALIAFIFDLVLFFVAKARINSVKGGSAAIGLGIWLTLAAWILLFFAGCFYSFGRCCISNRSGRDPERRDAPKVDNNYAEQMRLDAVKAEADRKARQAKGEVGLPAFNEFEQTPLNTTKHDDGEYVEDGDHIVPFDPNVHRMAGVGTRQNATSPSGYSQAAVGTRAVDDYYNASAPRANAYPPRRQPTHASGHTMSSSGYTPSTYSYNNAPAIPTIPPPVNLVSSPPPISSPPPSNSQYLAAGAQYGGHSQYPSAATQNYGHSTGGTTYHSATSHQQYPTNFSTQYADPYGNAAAQPSAFNSETYNNTGYMSPTHEDNAYYAQPNYPAASGYRSPPPPPQRSNTGGGYGMSSIPEYVNNDAAYSAHYPVPPASPFRPSPHSPPPGINTDVVAAPAAPLSTSPRGPRAPAGGFVNPVYEDSPPVYDAATAQPPGEWGSKQ